MVIYPVTGSSPRGRGTLLSNGSTTVQVRFIPAWAGNTTHQRVPPWRGSVHPRVGGEHLISRPCHSCMTGSSPRGRGTRRLRLASVRRGRFIPAWAGNTSILAFPSRPAAVHPRVGGEHGHVIVLLVFDFGSSPRGRGTQSRPLVLHQLPWFIPAWAGNTQRPTWRPTWRPVHPRVGGEHCRSYVTPHGGNGSSPRGRGTHRNTAHHRTRHRFIPAWAGNTRFSDTTHCCRSVHPRVGGEHEHINLPNRKQLGSSPRGRGTLTHAAM